MPIIALLALAIIGCGPIEDGDLPPEDEQPVEAVEDAGPAPVCAPEGGFEGRIGCVDEQGACITYACCSVNGCGPDGEPCDCCALFVDEPLGACD